MAVLSKPASTPTLRLQMANKMAAFKSNLPTHQ